MEISIGIGEIARGQAEGSALGLPQIVEQARQAEQQGFAGAWIANINSVDAMTACAVVGAATERLRLGTGVVPTFPRHPFAMAQQALTTQAATGNRFTLGIGLSHKIVIENTLGLSFDKPFSHMKEYLAVLAPLIRQGRVRHKGQSFTVNTQVVVVGAEPCPIVVAALAPKMLALAGEVADGTITWMTGVKTLREYVCPRIGEAAERAGRPKPRVVVGLPVVVTDDVAAARKDAAQRYQVYGGLPSYRAMLDREGAAGPADIAIVGDEDAVGEQLAALEQAGATELLAAEFPVGPDAAASLARTRETLRRFQQGQR